MRSADVVYVNSVMSKGFTVLPLLVLGVSRWHGRLLSSPRGELAASALALGTPWQKRAWIGLLRGTRWALRFGGSPTTWVVSSARERADVERVFPGARTAVVPERLRPLRATSTAARPPRADRLRVVTVGRVAPVKGIDDLVRGLAHVTTPVHLDVLGLLEDEKHVALVQDLVGRLPAHVDVRLAGAVGPEEVEQVLRTSHLFALLTRGENFGHAIGEALRAGCPVLISDQTPWTDVANAGAGVVLDRAACESAPQVGAAVQRFADMDDDEWAEWSRRAAAHATGSVDAPTLDQVLDAVGRD
jgi:glycosyltransferase involved in cell wall biosynthesis